MYETKLKSRVKEVFPLKERRRGKVRKNLLWIFFTTLLILSVLNVNTTMVSAGEYPAIYIEPATTVDPDLTPGKNFTVSIYTNYEPGIDPDYWGFDIAIYQFTLNYDPNVLHGGIQKQDWDTWIGDGVTKTFNATLTPVVPHSEEVYVNQTLMTRITRRTDTWTGDGETASFFTTQKPVVARAKIHLESEKVYVNETFKTRYKDYTVNWDTGNITFYPAPEYGEPIKAIYDYGHYDIKYETGKITFIEYKEKDEIKFTTVPGSGAEVKAIYMYNGVVNGDIIVNDPPIRTSAKFIPGAFNNTEGILSLTVGLFVEEGEFNTGPGTLANVTFTVMSKGTSNITIGPETRLIGWNIFDYPPHACVIIDAETMPTHIQHGYFDNRLQHDVAVPSVTAPAKAAVGELVPISVEVANIGASEEEVNVTIRHDTAYIASQNVTLAPGANSTASFSWNTTGVAQGTHTINATATIPGDGDLTDNWNTTTILLVEHDVAIISLDAPANATVGELVPINVTVANIGASEEEVNVTIRHDTTYIDSQNVRLLVGESETVSFSWDTTGIVPDFYTIAAEAVLDGDVNPDNNLKAKVIDVRPPPSLVSPYIAVVPQSTVDTTLTPGKNYTVSIYTDYNGTDIWGYEFALSYNPNVLEGIEIVNGDLITTDKHPDAMFDPGTFNNTLGKLSLPGAYFYYEAPPAPTTYGPGTLANVTFRVKGTGDSNITLIEDKTELRNPKKEFLGIIISKALPSLHHILHGYFRNTEEPVTHDMAVISVTPSQTSVTAGELVNITVVVENQGTVVETFVVTAYYHTISNRWLIGTKTVQNLAAGANKTLTFAWDTTGVPAGNHTITAVAEPVPGETDTDDNTLQSDEIVTVLVRAIYIRADGRVDPPTAPISSVDNVTYTFTADINESIVVERDNIVVDGAGYTLQGTGSGRGIDLTKRINVTIKNMEIKVFWHGICLFMSSNNSIFGNNITNNRNGIYLDFLSSNNIISGNNITENIIRGILIYSSNNTIISGNNIANNYYSVVLLWWCRNTVISGNSITNNGNGILLASSSNNTISGNSITNNGNGILLASSSNNTISGNSITSNGYGILLDVASNNVIYHNNFVNNTQHVYDESWGYPLITPSINTWDDGYPSGGNYWSDYTDVDLFSGPYQNVKGSDGIWDHPYTIYANNRDRYPLKNPWSLRVEHDLSVRLDAPNYIEPGHSTLLNATVYNRGLSNETNVKLELIINDISVNSTVIDFLPVDASYTLSYVWTPTDEAIFNVTVNATPVPEESITANNVATKLVTVTYPLIHPMEGQWANYTLYYVEYDRIIRTGKWNLTYDQYVSPYLINITMWQEMMEHTYSYWVIVNIMNREIKNIGGPFPVPKQWFFGWIETDIALGSTVNLLYSNATVVGSRIIEVDGYFVDCWELEYPVYYYPYPPIPQTPYYYLYPIFPQPLYPIIAQPKNIYLYPIISQPKYTLWYDKVSGLLIGMELGSDYYQINLKLDATNIPIGVLPVASFTYAPSEPVVAETLTFNATDSYDPDGETVSYTWDFGDGTTGSGMIVTHTYATAGTYTVTLTVTDDDGLTNTTTSAVTVSRTTLDIEVDVGSIHFRGEMAEFYVLVSSMGEPVDADISATLYYSNGTLHEDLTGSVEHTATGLYWVPYTMPLDAPAGTYALVFNASFLTLKGASIKSFLLSPTLTSWNAWLVDVQGDIATIETDVATIKVFLEAINAKLEDIEEMLPFKNRNVAVIKTDIGTVRADLTDINAELIALDGSKATIKTDVGTLNTDTESIELKVTNVDGDIATISTTLGVIQGRVLAIQGDVATIETDIGVVEAPLPPTKATPAGISLEWTLLLFAAIAFMIAIAAVLLKKLKGASRTKPTNPYFF